MNWGSELTIYLIINMMNRTNYIASLFIVLSFNTFCQTNENSTMKDQKYNQLTKEEERVIVNKGTEYPFSGNTTITI